MFDNKFNTNDHKQVVDFLNFIATKASFKDWSTTDTITHFRLLQHMQTVILPKIEANTLEIVSVTHGAKPSLETKQAKTAKAPK